MQKGRRSSNGNSCHCLEQSEVSIVQHCTVINLPCQIFFSIINFDIMTSEFLNIPVIDISIIYNTSRIQSREHATLEKLEKYFLPPPQIHTLHLHFIEMQGFSDQDFGMCLVSTFSTSLLHKQLQKPSILVKILTF